MIPELLKVPSELMKVPSDVIVLFALLGVWATRRCILRLRRHG